MKTRHQHLAEYIREEFDKAQQQMLGLNLTLLDEETVMYMCQARLEVLRDVAALMGMHELHGYMIEQGRKR